MTIGWAIVIVAVLWLLERPAAVEASLLGGDRGSVVRVSH